ncbi:hypothetical protein AW878_20755 [Bordetella pseudohinzii]|uniref:D-glucuronyl C5-epimerase C-terminal domain-containing protein n=1 Tax=Bordetella pseudohinzii TaxID=1331258 RepID=A0ABM6DHT8_9BORD|nr:hypothetical protein BBN53_14020 [Bordetella pseudohinzii]KMM24643.1 hypothetical protein L540_05075 [Bordetella pseudohinzii]KXA75246.1 hypothetical protein AW878_20755 [Bordetella pseudohinzii]KXA76459.1 hypothetical protein AW877_16945 [Bordetella pseudohinzii]
MALLAGGVYLASADIAKLLGQDPRYQLVERTKEGQLVQAQASVYKAAKSEPDTNGVVSLVTENGERHYHPFSVATQALADNGVEGTAGLYLQAMIDKHPQPSPAQLAALKWLTDNKVVLPNGAVTWSYPLPLYYSTFTMSAGWASAFSQARIIHALTYAAHTTRNADYLQLALAAAKAYATTVEDGGLQDTVDSLPFYEEVPVPDKHSPHILNGHLYSTVVLYDLARESGDAGIAALAEQGAATARKLAHYYDSGYWTKYDLIPRVSNISFLLRGAQAPVTVKTGTLIAPTGESMPLTLAAVSGNDSYFNANLPGPIFFNTLVGHSGYTIRLTYTGELDGIGVAGMRPDVSEYYRLPTRIGRRENTATTLEAAIPIQYLSDSTLSRTYQRWHARLMTRLGEFTGQRWFHQTASRWMEYDARLDADQKAGKAPAPFLRDTPDIPKDEQAS